MGPWKMSLVSKEDMFTSRIVGKTAYWLVNRDPYSGLSLQSLVFHPLHTLNNQGPFFSLLIFECVSKMSYLFPYYPWEIVNSSKSNKLLGP